MATPVTANPIKPDLSPNPTLVVPASPTSSLKTNTSAIMLPMESHSYQQFPAQSARIPPQPHPTPAATSPTPLDLGSDGTTPNMVVPSESSWPDGFTDLHLSASEPRIFPGVVSRHQRRKNSGRGNLGSAMESSDGDE
jgi:AMP deaminase